MADHGFTIESDLKKLKVDVNIPSLMGRTAQLTAAELKESQTITSGRIHAERAIQKVQKFKLIRNKMPLTLHSSEINCGQCVVYCVIFIHPLFKTRRGLRKIFYKIKLEGHF